MRSRAVIPAVLLVLVGAVYVPHTGPLGADRLAGADALRSGESPATAPTAVDRALHHVALRSRRLGIDVVEDRFTVHRVLEEEDGAQHVHLLREHRGLPVLGGDLIAHWHADGAVEFSLVDATPLEVDTRPFVTEADAVEIAMARAELVGALLRGARLVIHAFSKPARLAYEVRIDGEREDTTPAGLHVLVDAANGRVLGIWDDVMTIGAPGTGRSMFRGEVEITTSEIVSLGNGERFLIRDPLSGLFLEDVRQARDVRSPEGEILTLARGDFLLDADNTWGNHSPDDLETEVGRQTAAVDVYYALAKTAQYFREFYGRQLDTGENGESVYARIHYGTRYPNAFWSNQCFCVTFGDGNGRDWGPMVSFDLVAHEFVHGITATSAGLPSGRSESGGLNEATSDIFAVLIEAWAENQVSPDFRLFEDTYTPEVSGDALRYMALPSLDGRSVDCWGEGVGDLLPHRSAGIANRFFFLLSVGTAGASAARDCPDALSRVVVEPIGAPAAGRVWFRALNFYMTQGTDFAAARVATLRAARDIYGLESRGYRAVSAAWGAVNVPLRYLRGDADADGRVTINDVILVLDFQFRGGPPLNCAQAADLDGDGQIAVTEPVSIVQYLFLGGEPPHVPANECVRLDAGSAVTCESYPAEISHCAPGAD